MSSSSAADGPRNAFFNPEQRVGSGPASGSQKPGPAGASKKPGSSEKTHPPRVQGTAGTWASRLQKSRRGETARHQDEAQEKAQQNAVAGKPEVELGRRSSAASDPLVPEASSTWAKETASNRASPRASAAVEAPGVCSPSAVALPEHARVASLGEEPTDGEDPQIIAPSTIVVHASRRATPTGGRSRASGSAKSTPSHANRRDHHHQHRQPQEQEGEHLGSTKVSKPKSLVLPTLLVATPSPAQQEQDEEEVLSEYGTESVDSNEHYGSNHTEGDDTPPVIKRRGRSSTSSMKRRLMQRQVAPSVNIHPSQPQSRASSECQSPWQCPAMLLSDDDMAANRSERGGDESRLAGVGVGRLTMTRMRNTSDHAPSDSSSYASENVATEFYTRLFDAESPRCGSGGGGGGAVAGSGSAGGSSSSSAGSGAALVAKDGGAAASAGGGGGIFGSHTNTPKNVPVIRDKERFVQRLQQNKALLKDPGAEQGLKDMTIFSGKEMSDIMDYFLTNVGDRKKPKAEKRVPPELSSELAKQRFAQYDHAQTMLTTAHLSGRRNSNGDVRRRSDSTDSKETTRSAPQVHRRRLLKVSTGDFSSATSEVAGDSRGATPSSHRSAPYRPVAGNAEKYRSGLLSLSQDALMTPAQQKTPKKSGKTTSIAVGPTTPGASSHAALQLTSCTFASSSGASTATVGGGGSAPSSSRKQGNRLLTIDPDAAAVETDMLSTPIVLDTPASSSGADRAPDHSLASSGALPVSLAGVGRLLAGEGEEETPAAGDCREEEVQMEHSVEQGGAARSVTLEGGEDEDGKYRTVPANGEASPSNQGPGECAAGLSAAPSGEQAHGHQSNGLCDTHSNTTGGSDAAKPTSEEAQGDLGSQATADHRSGTGRSVAAAAEKTSSSKGAGAGAPPQSQNKKNQPRSARGDASGVDHRVPVVCSPREPDPSKPSFLATLTRSANANPAVSSSLNKVNKPTSKPNFYAQKLAAAGSSMSARGSSSSSSSSSSAASASSRGPPATSATQAPSSASSKGATQCCVQQSNNGPTTSCSRTQAFQPAARTQKAGNAMARNKPDMKSVSTDAAGANALARSTYLSEGQGGHQNPRTKVGQQSGPSQSQRPSPSTDKKMGGRGSGEKVEPVVGGGGQMRLVEQPQQGPAEPAPNAVAAAAAGLALHPLSGSAQHQLSLSTGSLPLLQIQIDKTQQVTGATLERGARLLQNAPPPLSSTKHFPELTASQSSLTLSPPNATGSKGNNGSGNKNKATNQHGRNATWSSASSDTPPSRQGTPESTWPPEQTATSAPSPYASALTRSAQWPSTKAQNKSKEQKKDASASGAAPSKGLSADANPGATTANTDTAAVTSNPTSSKTSNSSAPASPDCSAELDEPVCLVGYQTIVPLADISNAGNCPEADRFGDSPTRSRPRIAAVGAKKGGSGGQQKSSQTGVWGGAGGGETRSRMLPAAEARSRDAVRGRGGGRNAAGGGKNAGTSCKVATGGNASGAGTMQRVK